MAVVTFDTRGWVSEIRFETIRSELHTSPSWWTLLNFHFVKNIRMRAMPAKQAVD